MYYICLMTEQSSSDEDRDAPFGGHYQSALENLRATVKWLVASAGAVVAAIIAGAQLIDYSDRSWLGAGIAAIAVVVALSLAIALVARAAKILTVPRSTIIELANAETREGPSADQQRIAGIFKDPNVEWILARSSYLLGQYKTVSELRDAYDSAVETVQAGVGDGDANRRLGILRSYVTRVEDAAHYRDTADSYNDLMGKFRNGSIAFVAAVIAFSISGLFQASPEPKPHNLITEPVPVRVQYPNDPESIAPSCRDRAGVAIDGTLAQPTVVVPATAGCVAGTVEPGHGGAVVIPQISPEP